VLGRQRPPVQLVGQQHVAGGQAVERQILDEPIAGFPGKLATVEPVRPKESRARIDAELIEERDQIDAAPADVRNAACRHLGLERIAAALMHGFHELLRPRFDVVEREGAGAADHAVDGQRPSGGVDPWNAEMGEDEEIIRTG
jgi:hypothetical protein